jgi:phosphotransferase system HPr-like phosphotransfer protein
VISVEVRIIDERGEVAAVVKVKYARDSKVTNEVILKLIEAGLSVGDKVEVLKDGLFVAVVES